MKIVSIISAVLTFLLLFSTLICGLWIGAQEKVDPSSISFHRNIGIAAAVLGCFTCVLLFVMAVRR